MRYMLNSSYPLNFRNVFVLEDGFTEETTRIIDAFGAVRVTCQNQTPGLPGLNGYLFHFRFIIPLFSALYPFPSVYLLCLFFQELPVFNEIHVRQHKFRRIHFSGRGFNLVCRFLFFLSPAHASLAYRL